MLCLSVAGMLTENANEKKSRKKLLTTALICSLLDTLSMVAVCGNGITMRENFLMSGIAVIELIGAARIAYGRNKPLRNGIRLLCVTALVAGLFQLIPIRNAGMFCLAGTFLFPILRGGIRTVFQARQTRKWMYEVKLSQQNEEKCFSAFMDTGNRLRFYGSRLPVVLVDEIFLNEWIRKAERDMPQKLVFLPYKGVGGKGLLRGVRVQMELAVQEDLTLNGEVAAVVAEHRLFRGCGYQMILQPEVLTMECVQNAQEGVHNVI